MKQAWSSSVRDVVVAFYQLRSVGQVYLVPAATVCPSGQQELILDPASLPTGAVIEVI